RDCFVPRNDVTTTSLRGRMTKQSVPNKEIASVFKEAENFAMTRIATTSLRGRMTKQSVPYKEIASVFKEAENFAMTEYTPSLRGGTTKQSHKVRDCFVPRNDEKTSQ